jgi:FkbM family methyltransferase
MENNKFVITKLEQIKRYSTNLPGLIEAVINEVRLQFSNIFLSSFSQSGEDILIDRLLGYKKNGLYVDVGAFDPIRYSNTKRFYDKGWRGINIEPNSQQLNKFTAVRTNDINLNLGVGLKTNKLTFYKFLPEALSTFSKTESKKYLNMGFTLLGKNYVPVAPLSHILNTYCHGQKIDILTIDTEGSDYAVLSSNDWKAYRPRLICVETFTSPTVPSTQYHDIHNLLYSKNYVKVANIGLNSIFMENKLPSLNDLIKPSYRHRLKSTIPNFLTKLDTNKQHQASIWDKKTYRVDPKTHIFTTIQERYGNRLIHKINLPTNGVVLDVGCFIGEKLWQLPQDKAYLGIGIDIATSALKTANAINCYNHKFITADLEQLPFVDNSIDQVLVFDVIEHISDANKGFSEIARVLKPGGKLLLHIPIKDNKWSLFWIKQQLFPKAALDDYMDVGHTDDKMLDRFQIRQLMINNGLTIDKEIPFNAFFTHLFDRELFKIFALIFVKLFRSGKLMEKSERTTHTGNLGIYRSIYGKVVLPVLEVMSWPDRLFEFFGIGNTMFIYATKNSQKDYYLNNLEYSKFLNSGTPTDFKIYTDEILERLVPNGKFLDVGCGTGIVVSEIDKQSRGNTFGIEISKTSVKLAHSKNRRNVREYDGITIPFKSNYFDIVGSFNVIEHVDNVERFLTESLRVLKPGGYLIIGAPNFLTITSSYHYRMRGIRRKFLNILTTMLKGMEYILNTPLIFNKFSPVISKYFQPDDDAVNLINPVDIFRWGKQNKLNLIKYWGAITPNYLSFKLKEVPVINLLTGGVFAVFRKQP